MNFKTTAMDKLSKKIMEIRAERNRALILSALNMNEAAYNQLIFDNGIEFCKRFFLNDTGIENVAAKSRLFWAWFRNQWNIRDKQFIYDACLERIELPLTGDVQMIAIELYYDLHAAANIHVVPNRFVHEEMHNLLMAYMREEYQRLKILINGKQL